MADDWISTFDGVFFITIATVTVGFFGLIIKTCIRSKCEHFSLCFGLIKVDRRVDLEVQEDLARIEHGLPDIEDVTQNQTATRRQSKPSGLADNQV